MLEYVLSRITLWQQLLSEAERENNTNHKYFAIGHLIELAGVLIQLVGEEKAELIWDEMVIEEPWFGQINIQPISWEFVTALDWNSW